MSNLLTPGDVIGGRYRIDQFVAAGGMQEVYRATDKSLQRIIALKIPKNESAGKRFQRSAAMSARVTHPNVAKTFDYLVDGDTQFLVEEFVDGEDLRSRLASHFYYLDPHLAAHVFHHLVKGLAAVHSVDVVHRDLKPSNIMVSQDPHVTVVKITDFGIAKMTQAELEEGMKDEQSMVNSATVLGALPYMAPEVIENAKDVSQRADVWSCGAILFHLLTGERPFGDGLLAVPKILKAQMPEKPPHLSSTDSELAYLANELWALITKCLSASPTDRPTAAQLAQLCGRLCYSTAPRSEGVVKNYRTYKGNWGFVRCDGEFDDAFFHGTSYWGETPLEGGRVSFSRFPGSPSPRAHPVLGLRPALEDIPY